MSGTQRSEINFDHAPLDEVVLGVQFSMPTGYHSLMASDVWQLYRSDFPGLAEQPALLPQFETFGGHAGHGQGLEINFGGPQQSSRYWFLSSDDTHLIQFQHDRLLLNWRKRVPNGERYPRYSRISQDFERYLNQLNKWCVERFREPLDINQCEVSYINFIAVEEFQDAGRFIKLLNTPAVAVESLNANMTEVIHDGFAGPSARMYYELGTAFSNRHAREKAVRLGLTCRGKPTGGDVESAMDLLHMCRDTVVNRFCDITTQEAHIEWGRTT